MLFILAAPNGSEDLADKKVSLVSFTNENLILNYSVYFK